VIVPTSGVVVPVRRGVGLAQPGTGRVTRTQPKGAPGLGRALAQEPRVVPSPGDHRLEAYQRWVPLGDYVDCTC